jgi:hypothetical protein
MVQAPNGTHPVVNMYNLSLQIDDSAISHFLVSRFLQILTKPRLCHQLTVQAAILYRHGGADAQK